MGSVRHQRAPAGLRDLGPQGRVRSDAATVRCRECGLFSLDTNDLGLCRRCRGEETKGEEANRVRHEKAAARRVSQTGPVGETWADRVLAAQARQDAAKARRAVYGRRTA